MAENFTEANFADDACDNPTPESTLGNCDSNSIGYYVPSPHDVRSQAMHMAISSFTGYNENNLPATSTDIINRAKAFEDFLNELIAR